MTFEVDKNSAIEKEFRALRRTNFYVLLKLANDECSGLPVFVEARTRRIAIKKAKREARKEPGHWVTDVAFRWTSEWKLGALG